MRDLHSKVFRGLLATILFSATNIAFTQTLRINEFLTLNESVLADEDGEYSDWMEIYNAGGTTVYLQDWALTDEKEKPLKWLFPDISLNAGEYLLVFASGKDRSVKGSELHTNFKLSASGEYLALVNSFETAITEFDPEYAAQQSNFSYGIYENNYIAFTDPTPGEDNALSNGSVLPAPEFNVKHGLFDSPFSLVMSSSFGTSDIYYTTDGSDPSQNNGTLYNSALQISTTSIIRAVALDDGNKPSTIATQTYIFIDDVIHQNNTPEAYPVNWGPYSSIAGTAIADYEMDPDMMADAGFAKTVKEALLDIPTISLVANKDHFFSHVEDSVDGGIYIYTGVTATSPGRGWERAVSFEYFDNNSISVQADCGIQLQGGASRKPEKSPKHSFVLEFKSEYGPSKLDYPMFDGEASSKYNNLVLRAGFNNSWVHHAHDQRQRSQHQQDIWTKDTQRDMGHPSSNSSYVHLYINGIYWGIYAPSERMDKEFAAKYSGGDEDDYDVIKDFADVADGSIDAWNEMMQMANAGLINNDDYQRFQGNHPDGTPYPEIEAMADVVNLADYMLINFFGSNADWDHHNWAAMRNRVKPGKGFKFMCWDAEHMLNTLNGNTVNENNPNCPSNVFQQLMQNEEYKRLFADRVQKHCYNNGALTPAAAKPRWMKRSEQIETAIYAESARWSDYRRDVHQYQTSGPFDLYTVEDYWLPHQDLMLDTYFPDRIDVLISQLRNAEMFPGINAPVYSINGNPLFTSTISLGDALTMYAPEGTTYYTIDGTDPAHWSISEGGTETILLKEDADKRVIVPKSDIGTSWFSDINFDDSGWQVCSGSPGGVGYEKISGYENLISLDVGNDMYNDGGNPNTSCYIRIPFQLESDDLSDITALAMNVRYDDGFTAYLNGDIVAQANAPATIAWNSSAPNNHEADIAQSFNISQFISTLSIGENILAIHGINKNTSSSDFIVNASITASNKPLGGAVSNGAILYSGSVTLDESSHVIARTFHNGVWSAASDKFFVVPADYYDLKITEIHYNPPDYESIDGSKFEFIEIKNTGTSTLDLGGLQFISGIEFEFPPETQLGPQEFIVLASNYMDFYSRYNFIAFEEYSGKLDNNGEWLVLVTNTSDTISAFRYNDAGAWPELPDGEGNSLVSIDFNPVNAQLEPGDWRASLMIGGSPGADDTPPSGIPITEINSSDDFVLAQNYPNPFSLVSYIDYQIPHDAHVQLTIYNVMGQQITTLVSENQAAGLYQVEWNANDMGRGHLPNGIYFYRLAIQSPNNKAVLTRKMVLMR